MYSIVVILIPAFVEDINYHSRRIFNYGTIEDPKVRKIYRQIRLKNIDAFPACVDDRTAANYNKVSCDDYMWEAGIEDQC